MKYYKLLKSEEGAATIIEASIIFPTVFFIVIVLFIMGIFQLELATLQMKTDRIADTASRIISQSAYAYYGEIGSGKIDFSSPVSLNEDSLKKIYKDLNPYRYWNNKGGKISNESDDKLKDMFYKEQYMNVWILSKTIGIEPKRTGISNKVVVKASLKTKFPSYISVFGLPTEIEKTFTSTGYVSDTSEFMRNTDLVFRTVKVLSEKFNISENMDDIVNKIKEQFKFLGLSN